jgi:hypothetical protein
MTELRFGVSLVPTLDLGATRRAAAAADRAGLDYIGVQDHPYVPRYLDAFVVIADLLARTEATPRPLARSGADPVRAGVPGWVELLTRLATEQPFTTFVLWPQRADEQQIRLFAEEVAPAVRERVGSR